MNVYSEGHYGSPPAGGIKLTRSIAIPPTRTAATSKCFDFPGLRLIRPSLLKEECPATHNTQHTRQMNGVSVEGEESILISLQNCPR